MNKLIRAWGDNLIKKTSDLPTPISSAPEYNFRGLDKANKVKPNFARKSVNRGF